MARKKKSGAPPVNQNLIAVNLHWLSQKTDPENVARFLKAFLPSRHIEVPPLPPQREDPYEYPGTRQRKQVLDQAVQLYEDKEELIRDAALLWETWHKDKVIKAGIRNPLSYPCFGAIWKILLIDRSEHIPFWRAYFSGTKVSFAGLGMTKHALAKLVKGELTLAGDTVSRRAAEDHVELWRGHVFGCGPAWHWDCAAGRGLVFLNVTLPWLAPHTPCVLLMSASSRAKLKKSSLR
jgi:hypothetical protein